MPTPTAALPSLLCVDDETSNLSVIELRLSEHYDVKTASTDRDACAILRRATNAPLSVVLMDIQLVGSQLDGIALTRLIRGKLDQSSLPSYAQDVPAFPDLPVLFVTAFGEQYEPDMLTAAGGTTVITKPVDFVKLQAAITRHHLRTLLSK